MRVRDTPTPTPYWHSIKLSEAEAGRPFPHIILIVDSVPVKVYTCHFSGIFIPNKAAQSPDVKHTFDCGCVFNVARSSSTPRNHFCLLLIRKQQPQLKVERTADFIQSPLKAASFPRPQSVIFLCSITLLLSPFPLSLPFSLSQPLCSLFSNKSHLIVHFLSWPGARCQSSCMKCSSTALPASTFVQRKNNKKIPQSLLNSPKRFFFTPSFWRGGKTALDSLFVLLPCPSEGTRQPSHLVTPEDLLLFPENVSFLSGFYRLLLLEKKGWWAGEIFTGVFEV